MAKYTKPIDLENLQAYLHGRGIRNTLLTVKSGVQQLEITDRRARLVIDQAGNLSAASGSYGTLHPEADSFTAEVGTAVKDFRSV